jgi:oligopeptide transport system substrate-binding protein
MRTRFLFSFVLVACLLLSAAPVLAEPHLAGGGKRTVRVPSSTDETINLEPDNTFGYASWNILEQLFVGLVDYDDTTNEIRPELATSWTVSPDCTVYTFTLRSGVTWSDGRPLTAHDAAFAMLRALDPARQAGAAYLFYLIRNAQAYNEGTITDVAQVGIEVLDNTTLRITVEQPASHLLGVLAHWAARPLPRHVIQARGDDWNTLQYIVSSGAYVLSEWLPGDRLTLDKNPRYYEADNVQIERIVVRRMSDAAAWQAYLDGELDTAVRPLRTQVTDPFLQAQLTKQPRPFTNWYGFNVSRAPFDVHWVRKAFCAAVDRKAAVRDLSTGEAEAAMTLVPRALYGHVDGEAEGIGIPFDPVQARQWLADGGYPNGQGLPPITVWYPTSPGHQVIAEYLRQSWIDNLGVTVELQSLPWGWSEGQYVPHIAAGEAQMFRWGWTADYNDAFNFLGEAIAERTPYGGWTSPEFESYMTQSNCQIDPQARRALLKQAEEIVVEAEAIVLPLYYSVVETASKPKLRRTYPGYDAPDVSEWELLAWRVFLPIVVKN